MSFGWMNNRFNDAVSIMRCNRMIAFGELEKIRDEAIMACFKGLSRNSSGGTKENHRQSRSR